MLSLFKIAVSVFPFNCRYYMFYWPLSSAFLGIFSNAVLGIFAAFWLYMKFFNDSGADDDESERSFQIDDIHESFFNTDTESFAANQIEESLERERGKNEIFDLVFIGMELGIFSFCSLLVNHVEEKPWGPIQSPNNGRKKKV